MGVVLASSFHARNDGEKAGITCFFLPLTSGFQASARLWWGTFFPILFFIRCVVMLPRNSVFAACGTTIFEVMSRLANEHGAVNLGQGFPEGLEPPALLDRLAAVAPTALHQYPPLMGLPVLRQAVAAHERDCWGSCVQDSDVMVTIGATEALACALFGLLNPGDEVVVIEPLYDSYLPIIRRAGAVAKSVRLIPPQWDLPREDLAAAFGPKTRLLLLNSPANPCGKVFSADELAFIAALVQKHDVAVLCDEVYEHLTFDGHRHIPLMSLPGMAERCIKIGSAGKIFSLTGWKVGWLVAPPALMAPIVRAHQFITCFVPPILQEVIAWGLDHTRPDYQQLNQRLAPRRDRLAAGLHDLGFDPLPCDGSYFLTVDSRALSNGEDDATFCRRMTTEAKVAAIPVSAFYDADPPRSLVRFCFAKTDAAIAQALDNLKAWKSQR